MRKRLNPDVAKELRAVAKRPGTPAIKFDYHRVEELAAIGLNQQQIADGLGCSPRTLHSRLADDAQFAEAINRGRATMRERIAGALFASARRRSLAAQIFLAKVHLRWREHEDPPSQLSPQQLAYQVREHLQRLDAEIDPEQKAA